ncbi:ankyrin repeat-containing domain protein [Aspergillus filifer]
MSTSYFQNPSISLLIDAGGADSPGQDTRSLINWAVWHNLFDLVKKLVSDRVDHGLQEFLETRPLYEAVRPGREEILSFLLTKISNVNWKDASGETALMKAAAWGASITTVELLFKHGADANCKNRYGCTSLMHAARSSGEEVTAMILKKTVEPEALDTPHQSALDYALKGRNEDNIELLLKHGITSVDENIMETAIKGGSPLIVQSLLNYSYKANAKNHSGETPLTIACADGNSAIAEQRMLPSLPRLQYRELGLMELLLKRRADVEGSTPLAPNSLGAAVKIPETEFTSLLLAHGADPNALIGNPGLNTTALMTAAHHNQAENIKLLLEHGASLNTEDFYGRTALFDAAGEGHIEAMQALLDVKAGIETYDLSGQTALFWAIYGGHIRASEMLVQAGANAAHANNAGLTPVTVVTRDQNEDMIKVLYS